MKCIASCNGASVQLATTSLATTPMTCVALIPGFAAIRELSSKWALAVSLGLDREEKWGPDDKTLDQPEKLWPNSTGRFRWVSKDPVVTCRDQTRLRTVTVANSGGRIT